MKRVCNCIFALVLAMLVASIGSANPNGEIKNSPLFKASLAQSIAKLEGRVDSFTPAGERSDGMPTGKQVCPNLPLTYMSTCVPSACGGETCYASCGGTCVSTCQSTCYNTCQGQPTCYSTCTNTCVGDPGACKDYGFGGQIWWSLGYYGQSGYDWTNMPGGYHHYSNGISVKFDDEGQWSSLGAFDPPDGSYYGEHVRTNTTAGVTLYAGAWITNGYVYTYNSNTVYNSWPPPWPSPAGNWFGIYY